MSVGSSGPLGDRYRFLALLGQGGFGQVWRACDSDGQQYAIKMVDPRLAADPRLVERFLSARDPLTGIRHPNVASVLNVVAEGTNLAVVTELVEGPSLRAVLRHEGTLAPGEACRLGALIADGLAAIHSRGIVHGDLKPTNVLVETRVSPAQVKLTDAGLATLVDLAIPGRTPDPSSETPAHMAPELVRGEAPTVRSDLYALGIVLFELTCGVPPFAGSASEVMQARLTMEPGEPAGVDPGLWDVIRTLTRYDPALRPATAADAGTLLRRLGGHLDRVAALPALTTPPAPRPLASTSPAPAPVGAAPWAVPAPSNAAPAPAALDNTLSQPAVAGNGWPQTPPPARTGHLARTVLIVVLAVLLVALVAATVFVLTRGSGTQTAGSAGQAATAVAGGDTSGNATNPASASSRAATPRTSQTPSVDARTRAQQQLDSARASSLRGLSLDDRWVLQLDSKYEGITDPRQTTASGSHTFGLPDIWAGHQDLATKVRGNGISRVLLLQSTDFGQQMTSPGVMWVTLADPGGINSYAAGVTMCSQLFPNLSGDDLTNSCLPRQLSAPH